MMAALLGDSGYGVMTAGSVAEGLELAREIEFDLFILDVRLPDGTGIELCQQLRKIRPEVPVIYYSAYGDNKASEAAVAACGESFLLKPLSISEIEREVARLLAGRAKPKA